MKQAGCTIAEWHASLRARAAPGGADPAGSRAPHLAAFRQTPPEVVQPPLTDDLLCLHRGGAKRVRRVRNGRQATFDVACDSLTLLPRGQSVRWVTEGPIDYVHLTLGAGLFDDLPGMRHGFSTATAELGDQVGFSDPLLAGLMVEMLRAADDRDTSRLYLESLLATLALRLVHRGGTAAGRSAERESGTGARGGLAGWRLRAVTDYLDAHRASDIAFDALVRVSGLSRAHFFRAFRQSTGMTPGRYLERMRVDAARSAIDGGAHPGEVARTAGFPSASAMTRAFRRTLAITPEAYRRCVR